MFGQQTAPICKRIGASESIIRRLWVRFLSIVYQLLLQKRPDPLLPIQDEPFPPLSISVGMWVVIRIRRWSNDRVSSGFQSYLSLRAAWTIVTSGEEKAPIAGSCLMDWSGSLRNVLFTSIAAFTRYSSLAFGLAFWSRGVSWTLTSEQITSRTLTSDWSYDNEMPVLCT